MHKLFHLGHSHLFIAPEANHQGSVAFDAIMQWVQPNCEGFTEPHGIVALTDTEAEGVQVIDRAKYWMRANERHEWLATSFVTYLPEFQSYRTSTDLAAAIVKRRNTLDMPIDGLIVFYDGASRMLPMEPEDHALNRVLGALPYLPEHSSIVVTGHTGSPFLPKRPLTGYHAHIVYQVEAPGVEFKAHITPIKPAREKPFALDGHQHDGGVITFTEREVEDA